MNFIIKRKNEIISILVFSKNTLNSQALKDIQNAD